MTGDWSTRVGRALSEVYPGVVLTPLLVPVLNVLL